MENTGIITVNAKRGASRGWSIQFSGEAPLLFTQAIALQLGLWAGRELAYYEALELETRLIYELLKERAFSSLARRAHAKRDLERKLKTSALYGHLLNYEQLRRNRGAIGEGMKSLSTLLQELIQELEKQGYIDDSDFAQSYLASMLRSKPKGRYLLRSKLWEKGVAAETIDLVLEDYDERAACKEAVQEFMRKGRRGQALIRSLASRGFPAGLSYELARKAEAAELTEDFE